MPCLKMYKSAEVECKYKLKYDCQRVFYETEEMELVNYVITIVRMHYGLTYADIRELGFKFARSKGNKVPQKVGH